MIAILAAVADNKVIGYRGELPWRLPADLKHFRELTKGNTIIMGWCTFASLGYHPLPGRRNIVVTSRESSNRTDFEIAHSLIEALEITKADFKRFIIGGSRLFEEARPIADSMHITKVRANPVGDVYFPEIDESIWELIANNHRDPDEHNCWSMDFQFYTRRKQ